MDIITAVYLASFVVSAASQCLSVHPDKQSFSGSEVVACRTTNMVCCADYCLANTSCYSVEWNMEDKKCWAHYKSKKLHNAYCRCTNFQKKRQCEPPAKRCMVKSTNSLLSSTRPLVGPANVKECLELCRRSSTCYGVSYNGSSCLWADTAAGLTGAIGTTTYIQNKACADDYYVKSSSYAGNPVENMAAVNAPSSIYCANLCTGTIGCPGFTFDKTTYMCYLGQAIPSVDEYIAL